MKASSSVGSCWVAGAATSLTQGTIATRCRDPPTRSVRRWRWLSISASDHSQRHADRSRLLRYVDPDQTGWQRHGLAVVQREGQGAMAVRRRPRSRVVLALVQNIDPAIAVEV